ncbi:MAG: VPLPA-CTERM sorting domain-containing protein [Syntrophales bacterium]
MNAANQFGLDQLKQTEISGLTPVPIPTAVWLLGTGLLGLAGIGRKFHK